MFEVITDEAVLERVLTENSNYTAPEQYGPLRWFDTSFRCASRGCASQTFCKVKGIPYCMKHALGILNQLLVGIEGGEQP